MRKRTVVGAGAALSLALVLPGAASAQTSPPLVWTAPVFVEHPPFVTGNSVFSVSCPSTSLCVASDAAGNIITSTDPGGTPPAWTSAHIPNAAYFTSVSCPATTFCVALSQPHWPGEPLRIFTSTDPAGGASAWVEAGTRLPFGVLSCPSSRLCVFGASGEIITSTNPAAGAESVWKVTAKFPGMSSTPITGMACPTTTFCMGVDGTSDVFSSANPTGGMSAWKVTHVSGASGLNGVTCPSASFCASIGSGDKLLYSKNPAGGASAWHKVTAPYLAGQMSCLSATFCIAIDFELTMRSMVFTTADPAGGAGAWQQSNTSERSSLIGLSCATATLCAAVDDAGNALTSTDPGGGPAAWNRVSVSGTTYIISLACPSVTFCAAGDDAGNILTSTNPAGGASAWHWHHVNGPDKRGFQTQFFGMSCPDTSLCVATAGNLYWSTNPTASAPTWSSAQVGADGLGSISCPTTSLCVAAAGGDIWSSTNPTGGASAWHAASVSALDVTCPSASLCLATGDNTIFASSNPAGGAGAWQPVTSFIAHGIGPISCPTTSFCAAIGLVDFGAQDGVQPAIISSRNPAGGAADWHAIPIGPADSADDVAGGMIACASASLCTAEFYSAYGVPDLFASADPASSHASAWVDTGISTYVVSCPSNSLCVAGSGLGMQIGTPPLSTTTTITSVTRSPVAGQPITISVRVTAAKTGPSVPTPGGTAVVTMSRLSCKAQLSGSAGVATGRCMITAPVPGAYHLSASYRTQSPYGPSQATSVPVTVAKARSSTVLKLSARRVVFGHEHGERLTVTVRPQFTGTPAGTVVISAKSTTICTLRHLRRGTASCRLSRRQLRPGRYRLIARYSGSKAFFGSKSPAEVLTVSP